MAAGPASGAGLFRSAILNNEAYVGLLVWNRLRYIKNPATGKRVSRRNPPELWKRKDVPEWRIIDDATWQAVKTRQAKLRKAIGYGSAGWCPVKP